MQSLDRDLIDRLERAERRFRRLCGLGLAVIVTAMLVGSRHGATAQQGNGLEQRVSALEQKVAALQTSDTNQAAQIAALQTTVNSQAATITALQSTAGSQSSQIAALQTASANQANEISALQTVSASQAAQIAALQAGVSGLGTQIAGLENRASKLESRASDLEDKTQFMTIAVDPITGTTDMYITGTNIHVLNGLGATNGNPGTNPLVGAAIVNGKGNLIIGYNESRSITCGNCQDVRIGSHNIVVGALQDYASFGCVNFGFNNGTWAAYSSVTGGANNKASATASSVNGGVLNEAAGEDSTVSGGAFVTESDVFGWAGGSFHTP